MCDSFVKLMKSEETYSLQRNYPNAFLLLSFIVRWIRQNDCPNLDLNSGEMFISDYRDSGIESRQKYRTALEKLVELGHISIIEASTCITKSITKRGTKVNLLSSSVYNVFQNDDNQAHNQVATKQATKSITKQFSSQNEEMQPSEQPSEQPIIIKKERNKKEEREKVRVRPVFSIDSSEEKIYIKMPDRELVKITQKEYDSLANNPEVGKEMLEDMLDMLDSFKGSSGKEYFSDFHVLKKGGWVRKKYQEEKLKSKKAPLGNREKVLEKFKNNEISNGYECFITEEMIAFQCLGGPTYYPVHFKTTGFDDQLQNVLYKIRWKQKLEMIR